MKLNIFLFIITFIPSVIVGQTLTESESSLISLKLNEMKLKQQKSVSISGIFISPNVGISFPMSEFSENSRAAFSFGGKLEYASMNIYPFVIGVFFQQQKYPGSEEFKALHRLNTIETKVTQFGGGVDIILSGILSTYFTIPFATLEVSMMKVDRNITPGQNNPGLLLSDDKIGITAGLGFTLFIFDFTGKYTFAGEYSSLAVGTRFHFPVIKF